MRQVESDNPVLLILRVLLGLVLFLPTGLFAGLFISFVFLEGGFWLRCLYAFMAVFFALQVWAIWRILIFRELYPPLGFHEQSQMSKPGRVIPVAPFDLTRHYDIWCSFMGEARLYEDVRITGIRTLEPINQLTLPVLEGYIEIEAYDGTRLMLQPHNILMLWEGGSEPPYRVLQDRVPRTGSNSNSGSD